MYDMPMSQRPPPYFGPPMPAPPQRRPSQIGPLLVVAGLGIALVGLFALPIQAFRQIRAQDVGFLQVRQLAAFLGEHPGTISEQVMSSSARVWWRYGLLAAAIVLIAVACVAVAAPAVRIVGLVVAGLAVLAGVAHGIALAKTSDYVNAAQGLRSRYTLYHDAGLGTWIGLAGLAAMAVGGLFIAVLPTLAVTQPRPR